MKIIRLFLFCAFFLALPSLCKFPFRIPPHVADIPFHPEWDVPLPPEIGALLAQPFTYLSHGNQATVFLSQDERYVLKLFRYTRSRFPFIHTMKDAIASWRGKKSKDNFRTKIGKTLQAAHIAHAEGRSFTQVAYCHLNLTEGRLPVATLHAHRTYRLPLDRYRFVVQKKVVPFKEALLAAKKEPAEMHRLIDSFVDLILARSASGICNSDPNLGPNFGFLGTQAVEIDFGNYRKPPFDPIKRIAEMTGYFTRFTHWLAKNSPEFIPYLHQKIAISYDQQNEETASPPRSL